MQFSTFFIMDILVNDKGHGCTVTNNMISQIPYGKFMDCENEYRKTV